MLKLFKKYFLNKFFESAKITFDELIKEDEIMDRRKLLIASVSFATIDSILFPSCFIGFFTSPYLPVVAILIVICISNIIKHSPWTKRVIWGIAPPAKLSNIILGYYLIMLCFFLNIINKTSAVFDYSEFLFGATIVALISFMYTIWCYQKTIKYINTLPPPRAQN
jgi:hypothetical protein